MDCPISLLDTLRLATAPRERHILHKLDDLLALGLKEMALAPTQEMPSWSYIQRNKVHRSLRLTDGQWHYFQFADSAKGAARDLEMSGPMLPKSREIVS